MIFNRRVTALVPIKEESERVPGKNFREFAGEPLYHHIIRTLDRTYAVDEVVIDTDSHRVLREAPGLSPKVKVMERPEELRGHKVSTNRIFAYDLTQVEADLFVQTHVTNPLLRAETIAEALRLFVEKEEEHDSLFGVNVYHSRFYRDDGTAINHDPADLIPTQELDPLYEENSCIYVFTADCFHRRGRRIGEKPLMFPIPPTESVDIDDEFAFRLAELLALYSGRTSPS